MGSSLSCCGARTDRAPSLQRRQRRRGTQRRGRTRRRSNYSAPNDDEYLSSKQDTFSQPLKCIKQAWTTTEPLTKEEIEKETKQFWDMAPSYGGKEEVWNALKAAIEAGDKDIKMARTILECAGVIMPDGLLTEVYDITGFKYEIPLFILSDPINLLEVSKENNKQTGRSRTSTGKSRRIRSKSDNTWQDSVPKKISIRFNTGRDVHIELGSSIQTVGDLSRYLLETTDLNLGSNQRLLFFYGGKGPFQDNQHLYELNIDSDIPLQAWIA